ncbi:MAG: DUF885 domain-containing protein [Anaerolineales bacterium]|nr:DUF885 domain-containing protein [Anaerolineales bacterium]
MPTLIYVLIAILVVVLLWWLISLIWGKPWSINHFYTRVFLEILFDNPEILTMIGMLERFGIYRHNAKLADASDAHEVDLIAKMKRTLKMLRSYNRDKMSQSQLLSTDILDWYIDDQLRLEPFRHNTYPVNQMFGIQSELPNLMMTMHPLNHKRGVRTYIKRLSRFGLKIDQVLEGLHIREEKGCLPPSFTVRHVLDEMKAFTDQPAAENPLHTVFKEKIGELKISPAGQAKLLTAVEREIEENIYPAYQKLIDYFATLDPKAIEDHGVWNLPDGDAYYALCLRTATSTDLTPEQVHEIGLKEVARIEGEMTAILDSLGYEGVNPTKQLAAFGEDERFLYPNTDEGRADCLAEYQRILDKMEVTIADVFDICPKAGLEVQRVPEFREKTMAGAYYQPSDLSGSRPGVFYANLRDMKETQKFGMKTLAYHEGIPGHHFQVTIAMELKGVPFFRRMIPFFAYIEGWAMYAENLARELGAYQDDPYGELGFLDSILFRAVRLVVDTGIHYKRWTREQAIEYMEQHTGQAHESVVSEIERYFVMPGQACAYKIGEIKMLDLRAKAQKEMGEKFDIRQFHNVILKNGGMPLTILEKVIDEYIETGEVP